ncbi:alpha-L-fucosidase [Mucilaginibacter sp.]|uniref:alpha-L-fucosidase n=1 Tax=Mucilaginibacter sp. TaxID=1882438 RepID=UPI00262BDD91|nr:alpha-L-fucosidase [Mucilaginibacter sp.]
MKRRTLLKSTAGLVATSLLSNKLIAAASTIKQPSFMPVPDEIRKFGDGRDWFFDARFGMFIHWGLYAIPAWHEQYQWRARVPRKEYMKLAQQWNPAKFDPDHFIDLAEQAGMKYICITTKHHDGFCMWDTKQTTYNTMNTPYKKDIIKLLADACHKRKMPLCFYYSIVDWNQPNYPNQGRSHELPAVEGDSPDLDKYLEFLKEQVKELCTNYGEIHGFWWDMNVTGHKDPSINAMIRKLQPAAVINNRGFDGGDYGTPERDLNVTAAITGFTNPTEACQSVGMESWGYRKDEDYYTAKFLMQSIDSYLTRGGNYLLNVGPTAEGLIPKPAADLLQQIGKWYKPVKESLVGVTLANGLLPNKNIQLTKRGNTLYVHFSKDIIGNGIKLKPISMMPKTAILLNNGKPIACVVNLSPSDHAEQKAYLRLRDLPVEALLDTVLIAKLEFDRPLDQITQTGTGKVNEDLIK